MAGDDFKASEISLVRNYNRSETVQARFVSTLAETQRTNDDPRERVASFLINIGQPSPTK